MVEVFADPGQRRGHDRLVEGSKEHAQHEARHDHQYLAVVVAALGRLIGEVFSRLARLCAHSLPV